MITPQEVPGGFLVLKQVIQNAFAVRAPIDVVAQEDDLIPFFQGQLGHQFLEGA
jgi:hypothetical protein